MILSDTSVVRPVFATVLGLLLVIFGLVAYSMLPLREYPDIDPPVVSIETSYRGAAASVVDSQITQLIEESIAGVEGVEYIESRSRDGRSEITIRFSINRDVNESANDIRDRVSSIVGDLPAEADPPEVRKLDANQDVIVWWNLTSDRLTLPELTDYADRYLVDRFATLEGVARVRVGGAQPYAMRVWLDREALAARNLTVEDVENALRRENVELPAGTIESVNRQFTVRVARAFNQPEDFASLVIARGDTGYLVRLRDEHQCRRDDREGDLTGTVKCCNQRGFALFVNAPTDVFQNDDRIIDNQTDSQHQRQQGQEVDRETEEQQGYESRRHGHRQGYSGHQDCPGTAEKNENRQDHQKQRNH